MEDIKQDEISLKSIVLLIKEWYAYLLSKFRVILIAGIIGAVLGVAYSLISVPKYTALLTFALEDEKSTGLGGALGLVGQLGIDVGGSGGGAFAGGNLIELFKSRSMVEQTLLTPIDLKSERISLAEMFIRDNNWRESWEDNPKLKHIKFLPFADRRGFSREQDSILEVIYKKLSNSDLKIIQKDKKIGIISVEMKSTNEVFSKNFTESLANVVSEFYIDTKSKKARINMTILQRQLDSIRGELNGSIAGVAIANDKTFGLNPALNVKRVPSVRKNVDVQANTAILTELVKQTELAKVTLRRETPLIQIIDKPIYPLKMERFGKLRGIVFGGFIAGFLTVLILIIRRIFAGLT